MLNSKNQVSVIIPVHNPPLHWEESTLEHIVALQTLLAEYKFHFILINDGSPMNVIRKLRKKLDKVQIRHSIYHLPENLGKGKALRTGLLKAAQNSSYYICVDWDFPFGITPIQSILEELAGGADVVLVDRGNEYLRKLPASRSWLTRLWRIFIRKYLGLDLPDTQGGLKGLSHKAQQVAVQGTINSFLSDLELILLCRRHKLQIKTVKAYLRGGVRLASFSLSVYFRELKSLLEILKKLQ